MREAEKERKNNSMNNKKKKTAKQFGQLPKQQQPNLSCVFFYTMSYTIIIIGTKKTEQQAKENDVVQKNAKVKKFKLYGHRETLSKNKAAYRFGL